MIIGLLRFNLILNLIDSIRQTFIRLDWLLSDHLLKKNSSLWTAFMRTCLSQLSFYFRQSWVGSHTIDGLLRISFARNLCISKPHHRNAKYWMRMKMKIWFKWEFEYFDYRFLGFLCWCLRHPPISYHPTFPLFSTKSFQIFNYCPFTTYRYLMQLYYKNILCYCFSFQN